ncbi:polysaccharide biosynthesis C-terminal domain-containing protein [Mucilaginibacter sp. Bleaf8]|uniref:lipopolysaccharide biosynthesis protein n=1 Tax=Mucilaginibacter sp. Bleaf8 TaxID=2834430 RepID=UPI001BCE5A82|nr:polysaccharide biosynthesis C-terminal domain-containing protein [Mucilaginibacter sp. Bleaf8]MBS7566172.1 polysaccharide biosynthesis C-terminal domain-containing protein [Mucilaginibacter sp. Bleaf8]
MGVIQQQTIKSSIYSYLGTFIAFISIYLIQPHALTTEQVGLVNLLPSYALLFAQFAMLGFNGTTRYFPYFRDEKSQNHGYLFLSCMVAVAGTILFLAGAFIFKDEIISQKSQKSNLFNSFYWYLVPLTVFTLFFNVFNLYARMLYNITTGTFLNEFIKRALILLPLALVYFKIIDFKFFMVIWLAANCLPTLMLMQNLIRNKQFPLKPDFKFLDKDLLRKLISICLFAILTGYAPLILQNLDSYFINKKYGLDSTGVYNLAFNLASIITVPTRALYGIAFTIVADAWKNNDLPQIRQLYEKSCINQLISSIFLFILIWANIDFAFSLLPPAYGSGKYVILFIGLGYIVDSATGINSIIIGTSKYFKYDSFFYVFLIGITILFNLLLIPRYGLTGAAMAYAAAIIIFNLCRYMFILFVFKMQPFTLKIPATLIFIILIYYASIWLFPLNGNLLWTAISRSTFIAASFGAAVYFLDLSEDINNVINKYLYKAGIKKHH